MQFKHFAFPYQLQQFVSCYQPHVLSSPRLLHTLRTYLPLHLSPPLSVSLPATTVSSLPSFAAAAASLQCVCCCILFIVQCICMSHPRTPRPVCVCECVCLHLRLLQFIYCMYICLRPIYTKNTCIYIFIWSAQQIDVAPIAASIFSSFFIGRWPLYRLLVRVCEGGGGKQGVARLHGNFNYARANN